MKLVILECPECSARLEVNSTFTYATCNYCGNHFLVDDESKKVNIDFQNPRQTGYEFELGRMDARVETPNYKLAEQVKELIEPISQWNALTTELHELRTQIEALKKDEKDISALCTRIKFFIVPLCILSIVIWMIIDDARASTIGTGVLFAVLSFLIADIMWRIKREEIRRQIGEKRKKYNTAKRKKSSIYEHYDLNLIPEAYRSERIVKYIYEVLNNQRAMNICQAVNLYEDDQHKARMEAMEKERVDLQRQQLRELQDMKAMREAAAEKPESDEINSEKDYKINML